MGATITGRFISSNLFLAVFLVGVFSTAPLLQSSDDICEESDVESYVLVVVNCINTTKPDSPRPEQEGDRSRRDMTAREAIVKAGEEVGVSEREMIPTPGLHSSP